MMSQTSEAVRRLSQAVDEIYVLRGLLAQTSLELDELVQMKSTSAKRKQRLAPLVSRSRLAASGSLNFKGITVKPFLKMVGAPTELTNYQWMKQRGLMRDSGGPNPLH